MARLPEPILERVVVEPPEVLDLEERKKSFYNILGEIVRISQAKEQEELDESKERD